MTQRPGIDRVKWFVFMHFELLLVVLMVASLVAIHVFVEHKIAFLSFYYLPIIAAGFFLGRKAAMSAAVFIVALVAFFQAVAGLEGPAGLLEPSLRTLLPWAAFLLLTAYTVGRLADQRKAQADDLKGTYVALLELLTFYLESSERHNGGHSRLVAERALAIGRELGLREGELEDLHVAGLLHEMGPQDPRFSRLVAQLPMPVRGLPVAGSMRSALDLVAEYAHYHEQVGGDWPVDQIRISLGAKILAVADAFETLLMPGAGRPPFAPWTAIEEIEKGAGQTFGTEVVKALKKVAAAPEPSRLALL